MYVTQRNTHVYLIRSREDNLRNEKQFNWEPNSRNSLLEPTVIFTHLVNIL